MPDATSRPADVTVEVPTGGRVLVVADLHLARDPSPAMAAATGELVAALDAWTGPGVVVVNGGLLAGPDGDGAAALASHPRLVAAVRSFAAGPGRRVLVLPGGRDPHLAWSAAAQRVVTRELSAEVVGAVDLHLATGAGERHVRVEPGDRLDPLAARVDAGNPGETPMAWHLRGDVLPSLAASGPDAATPRRWLAGVEALDDPAAFPRFLASRLAYRRLGRWAWLALVPVVAAFALRLPVLAARHQAPGWRIGLGLGAALVELALLALLAGAAIRSTWRGLSAITLGAAGRHPNAAARTEARRLVADGAAGLVTGHTCRPELTDLGTGFLASAGCIAEVVTEVPARLPGLGLPPVFVAHRQVAWVELEAGSDLHARLVHTRVDLPGATLLERLAARRDEASASSKTLTPTVVASWPHGGSWPAPVSDLPGRRRTRRIAATVVALAGFTTLVSSLSDPLQNRLRFLVHVLPLSVPETADALNAIAGLGLLVLARGIRRGQRRALVVCEALLLGSSALHLVKGVDVEEAVLSLAVAGYLWVQRAQFGAATERPTLRRGLPTLAAAAGLVVVAGTLGIELGSWYTSTRHHQVTRLPWGRALEASAERLVGLRSVALPHRIDEFFTPAMTASAIAIAVAAAALLFRPVVARRRQGEQPEGLERARAVVARWGSGTLDWFALRPDKQFFFWGETVVAYAVYGTVCLVSPDPIGPVAEREEAWRAFRAYVDGRGWALGGLGAGEAWLPIYRATGMHDLYVGDEAVVRVQRFGLEGGRFKGLRQAVNRVAKYGYTITFHDPATIDAGLRAQLEDVMTKSRRGDVERGFSMTLGRVFDPEDHGLLLAVVHGPPPEGSPAGTAGDPVAFCHYVPAPGIGGYSLDLMRRDAGEHPNGLIDFAVVETIRHLAAGGHEGLGLNFATMRAVLAGEAGEGVSQRVQAWLLRRMGDSMQIESLWRFNAKFDPDWQPRYAVYDAPENALAVAIAVARAESFWELPVIGRWLMPSAAPGGPAAAAGCEVVGEGAAVGGRAPVDARSTTGPPPAG